MNAPVAEPRKVWTEAELLALPENGFSHELVDGEIVSVPKGDCFHGVICADFAASLRTFADTMRLGAVLGAGAGFWMENGNCRSPDISFISRLRLKAHGFRNTTRRFFPAAPDLAVEVLSLNDTPKEMDERLKDFFSSGTRLAWIIDPEDKRVEVCRSLTDRRWVGSDGFLDGEDLLPGFRYPAADLFKDWDWE
jgi:Uma2 family endonuclease